MNILKQSTAATIKLGPFIDDTDGKTAETSLTISQADIRLSKNGGDIAQTNNSTGATHDELGYYNVPLDTTDTNTLGRLKVIVHESGALPVWAEYLVVTANVYDTLCSTDKLEVELATGHGLATATALQTVDNNVDAILVDTGTTLDTLIKDIPTTAEFEARTLVAANYFDPAADAVATVTNLTNLPAITTNWLTADGLAADAVAEIQNGLAKAANLQDVEDKVDVIATDTTTEIPASIASLSGKVDTIDNFLDTEIAAILADTNEIQTELADGGRTDLLIDGIKAKTDNIPASPAQAGEYTSALSAIQADLDNPSQYKADVSGLLTAAGYTAPDNTSITAIKAKTDLIPASPAAVGSAMTLADDAITSAKFDETTAFPLKKADATTTELARLDGAANYKADVSALATSSALATVDTVVDGIATTLATPATFKADVSSLATSTELSAIDDKIDTLDTVADGIATTLASPNNFKADVSGLATTTHLQEVEDKVDIIDGNVDDIETAVGALNDLTAQEVWEYVTRELTSAGSGGATAQEVWEYATRTLTGLPTMPTDWVTASGLKADAVTEIQSGLAKTTDIPSDYAKAGDAMTLTAAYDNAKDDVLTPLANVKSDTVSIKAKTDNLPAVPAAKGDIPTVSAIQTGLAKTTDLAGLALEATLTAMKGAGWNGETLVALMTAIESIEAGLTAQDVWQYASRSLTSTDAPADMAKETTLTAIDLLIKAIKNKTDELNFTIPGNVDATAVVDTSQLATAEDLEIVSNNVDDIKTKTNQLAFTLPGKVDAHSDINISGLVDDILAANVEGSLDLKDALRIILAFASGVSEGGGSKTIKYKDVTGLADRIIWTVDKFGDRLTSELDASDVE